MSQYKYAEIADTVYFWFAVNTTAGEADDGATPVYDVRLAGAAADAAPTASGAATLLAHANYSKGLHEIAIDTTGYAAGEYAVFCTILVSAVNPAGFCGSFLLRTAGTGALKVDLVSILGTVLTETAGLIAAGFKKFFNVATPTGTVNSLPDAVPGAAGGGAIAGSNAATTFATLSVTGQMDAGSVVIDAGFDVVGALSANSLLIDTTTTLTGNVSCAAAFDVVGALTAGSVSIDAGVDVVGALSANSVLVDTTTTLTGAVSLGSTLGVTGVTTFTGAVNANITGNITGNLSGSVGSLTGHTNQSGNSYPIVSHADYGNAKLVRSTTPANSLDVSATGEAGLDFDNIKDATGAHTLTNITVPTVTATGACTTNSDMRGTDSAATAAKLTKYVQLLARSDAAIATDNGTELTEINADGGSGGGDYSNQTEAVEALRDHIGDGTNLTEAGGTGDHLTAINLPNQTMDITGDITGNLSGSVGSVAGNVDGDVSGNVAGTVTGVTPSSHDAADVKTAIEAAGSHLTLIKAVTDALTAAAATKLATSTGTIVTGTVSHDNTAATTSIFYCDDITEATADHFNGRIIIFTSGALQYQATDITDYALVAGEGKFTVSTLTEAPADNTTFIIV